MAAGADTWELHGSKRSVDRSLTPAATVFTAGAHT